MVNISRFLQVSFILIFVSFIANAQKPTAQKLDANRALKKVDGNGISWFNPKLAPFDLVGFEWLEKDSIFRRLPLNPDWEIRTAVDGLANHTAGGQVRFRTNSKRILVKVVLRERSSLYHMPATGQSGFDLYMRSDEGFQYLKTTRFPHDTIQYQVELYSTTENKMHNFTLNFPLYNGVNSLHIGLDKGALLEPPLTFNVQGKVVIYGTSITQGGCVSRPGMLFSNILSRKLDAEFVNLGFSGNGRGEPELARLINQIPDTKFIILDYEANTSHTIKNSLAKFVDILREKQPEIPILIVSKIRYAREPEGSSNYKLLISNRNFQKKLVEERKLKGDKNIYFLDGSTILGEDYLECTVDGVHPSDLGSYRIAEALLPVIKEILLD